MDVGFTFIYIFIRFGQNFQNLNTIPQTYLVLEQVFFQLFSKKSSFFSLAFFYFHSLGKVAIKMVVGTGPLDDKTKYQYPK